MTAMTCAGCHEIAAELALGVAEGDQRADALEHLARCPACRDLVDHLAATADSLVLAAPSIEPPTGFEAMVLEQLGQLERAAGPRASRRLPVRLLAAAAAVVIVLAVGIGLGRWWAGPDPGSVDVVASGTLTAGSGPSVGEVRAYTGDPSWLFVTFPDRSAPPGTYLVQCLDERGYSHSAGTLTIDAEDPVSSWSARVDYRLDGLAHVRLVNQDGGADLDASIEH